VVLAVAGLLSLPAVHRTHRGLIPTRTGQLIAGGTESGGASGDAQPSAPDPPLPLFPSTSTTRPGRSTTTDLPLADDASVSSASGPMRPAAGTFTYAVDGSEATTGIGSRKLPGAMTMTVRGGPDQLTVDLAFGANHTEHEVLTVGADLIGMRSSTITATFGPVTRTIAGNNDDPIGRLALPLSPSRARSGTSQVRDTDGNVLRTEDWKVVDAGSETVTVGGTSTTAWVITLDRKSRPDASESVTETRKAWFDATRRVWVKWQTEFHSQKGVTAYDLNYTATLGHLS